MRLHVKLQPQRAKKIQRVKGSLFKASLNLINGFTLTGEMLLGT